tara:strand:+ start:5121 stop:5585 length:465 start_codon:yes stop_codon:yes gene_type:complete
VTNQPAVNTALTLLASTGDASLATLLADGAPFASLVTFAMLDDGSPVLLLSRLAQHTDNIRRDPRASLLVSTLGQNTGEDTQTLARATFTGRLKPVDQVDMQLDARAAFLARHPSAETYIDFKDFGFYRLAIDQVHVVEGFGRIARFDASALSA